MRRAKRRRRYMTVAEVRISNSMPPPDFVEAGYAVYLDMSKFTEPPSMEITVESRLTTGR